MTTPPPPPTTPPPGNYSDGGLVGPANDDDKTMGMLAHGGSILIGFIAPLLVMLIKKDSVFAQQESKEALNFCILTILLSLVTCGLFGFVALVFFIIATIQVSKGQPYRYPFNWRLIK